MRVGSMFAGIGGICIGFKQASAELVWANELDRYACATYRHNLGSDFLIEGDIRQVHLDAIPTFDILTAGFPCQSFSVMGNQQGFADPRGTMYYEILRVIDKVKPEIVFLENVKNLVQHDNGRTFITIYNTLAERGYGVKYSVQGAHTHANIPQYRDRIFIAAFLDHEKLENFSFPDEVPLTRKINDTISRNATADEKFYYRPPNRYYEALNARMTDENAIYRIDDSGVAKRAWEICPTLKANMGTYHDRVPLIRDAYGIRKLTPEDCLALQGFPKWYNFTDIPQKERYKQLGNTVCVPVVMRIARRILYIMK
ncbi:MAG: DNA (cytosine-5-)-methyltransferase [Defluviitaleaceae bacterium]|nr:DNA (cytosine-5-)-methyltransferase [Defluviitaleaceae bacterium]